MKKGFTLMEVVVAILVMGLVSTGLLNLLHWGRMRYHAIDDGWRERDVLKALHRTLRSEISAGRLDAIRQIPQQFERQFPTTLPLHCTGIDVRPYASDTVFVRPNLYVDRNRNGREDPQETLPAQVWCFRIRNQP